MRKPLLVVLCVVLSASSLRAQNSATKTDAELKSEYEQAQKLYSSNNFVAALPLFEDLHAQQPKDLIYEERLAMCLLGSGGGMTAEQDKAARERAKTLLLEAQKNGDNSPLLQTLLEKMQGGNETSAPAADSQARADFNQAEKLFGAGDLKGALALYQKALEQAPHFYLAALYAGDTYFKTGDCAGAGTYYAKAIAIDPDHETAYRYWADCLVKMHDMTRARDLYINAVLCQPYQKTPRQSLATWAELNHARIIPPPVTLPAGPAPGKKQGDITINIDPNRSPNDTSGDLMYSMSRAMWQGEKFKKQFPNEKAYRHSLAEEADAIRTMLSVSSKNPSSSTKILIAIEKDGMLESWILLDNPDQGIAQDYIAYRKDHRDLMHRYIEKYDVHPI